MTPKPNDQSEFNPDDVYALLERKHLSHDLQMIWDKAGKDTVVLCLKFISGMNVYIPQQKSLPDFMNLAIPELAKAMTVVDISNFLGCSVQYVKDTLRTHQKNK